MTAGARLRAAALPLGALALVFVVLLVQVVHGGGRYAPTALADPCAPASATRMPTTLDALGQDLVLLGLDGAACRLGTSREAFTITLARDHAHPSDAQVDAVRSGLLGAVDEMSSDNALPPAADLVDQALDASSLSALAKLAISALPDTVVDRALPTDEVLRQAVENLDVRALLVDLSDSSRLGDLVTQAVTRAVEQTLVARLEGLA